MSDLAAQIKATAQNLVLAAGAAAAIASTSVTGQANVIVKNFPQYTANQIANHISAEIRNVHRREIK